MNNEKNPLKIFWFFIKQKKLNFTFLIALSIFIGVLESLNVALIYPIMSGVVGIEINNNLFLNFIDIFANLIPVKDPLVVYSILFIILAFIVLIAKLFYFYFSQKLIANVVIDAKQNVFSKCMNLDYQFFIDNKQGEILYKTYTAPNDIANLLTSISNLLVELVLSVSVFALLLSLSWKATVIVVIGGIAYYYLTKYLSNKVSYIVGKRKLKSGQTETVVIDEYTTGVKQIKVFNTYQYWKDQFDNAIHTYWKYQRKGGFWERVPEVLLIFLVYICIGGAVIFIKITTPGSFYSTLPLIGTFAFAVFIIVPKISAFGQYRMTFMGVLPNVEAVYDLLKDTTYCQIKNGEKKFEGLNSSIEMRNVKFTHKERADILNDVTLEIKKNKITALVGPSGSGKSTVVNLLLRLHDVDSGGVFIDGTNIKEYDIFSFLSRVGFVSQETFIHNGSIKDNIVFGGKYTDQEVIEAAKLANLDDFIQQQPEKYDTTVGDQGIRLSGGEKQRIAIARAMIRKPEILILDEATSSLDNISERIVQNAINSVSKDCTTFVIAHRLSTIQDADIIYVIDNGRIVESGNHKQLLSKKGKYWELNNIQKDNNKS